MPGAQGSTTGKRFTKVPLAPTDSTTRPKEIEASSWQERQMLRL